MQHAKTWPWIVIGLPLMVVFATAIWAFPIHANMPGTKQSEAMLATAFTLKTYGLFLTLLIAITAGAISVMIWRARPSWWRRSLAVLLWLPTGFAVYMSQFNINEMFFNPLEAPSYVANDAVDWLADDDMVMLVELDGEAVAYPVRQLGYHHIVHDRVGGTPVTVTY